MKSFHSLFYLAAFFLITIIFTSFKCKRCIAPTIHFIPSVPSISKLPGEKFKITIELMGETTNVESMVVSKTSSDGITQDNFLSLSNAGKQNRLLILTDSIPEFADWNYEIIYTVTVVYCKDNAPISKSLKVTIPPSDRPLDKLFMSYGNSQFPRVYSCFTATINNRYSWKMVSAPVDGKRFPSDPDAEKDIIDSTILKDPYINNVRWGSRTGVKFVKAPSNFDYDNCSPKSIIEAFKAGTPHDIVSLSNGNFIIINYGGGKKYAVIKIKYINDTGPTNDDDNVLFEYTLAQL